MSSNLENAAEKRTGSRWRHARGHAEEEAGEAPGRPDVPEPEPAAAAAEPQPRGEAPETPRSGRELLRRNRPEDTSEVSVVGPGTRIEGTVRAAGSLRVEGEVKGSITAKGEVSLSPRGRVEADITAGSIVLAGRVRGNLAATGDVALPADSLLEGNIAGNHVQVGGTVKGDIAGKGKVELGPRARVEGDITSSALAIAAGAVFVGRSVMSEAGTSG